MSNYKLAFEVRDSEIDMQGVVNNGNYFIYFEHARHSYLRDIGFSFSKLNDVKIYLVLISSYIEYKKSLRTEDKFYVTCKMLPEGKVRVAFEQEIRRVPDDVLIATSRSVGVCLDGNNRNRPFIPEVIKQCFT